MHPCHARHGNLDTNTPPALNVSCAPFTIQPTGSTARFSMFIIAT
uniref:Uncharacterized protein n=1 Tax=Anguilla anguilla TaxID=7936 RepID=A0A0E9PK52_ANGAN